MSELTIRVERDANVYVAVWEDGEMAGDPEIVDLVESMADFGTTVEMTPTGPTVAVTLETPQTFIRALEEFGAVLVEGELPEAPWNETQDVDY